MMATQVLDVTQALFLIRMRGMDFLLSCSREEWHSDHTVVSHNSTQLSVLTMMRFAVHTLLNLPCCVWCCLKNWISLSLRATIPGEEVSLDTTVKVLKPSCLVDQSVVQLHQVASSHNKRQNWDDRHPSLIKWSPGYFTTAPSLMTGDWRVS